MKKAVFLDIDGTLLDCHNGITDITLRVKKAIRALQEEGDYVFIASGRPYAFIYGGMLDFGFDGFIFTNGTQVIVNNKLIYERSFDKDFAKQLILNFEKYNIQYILQSSVFSYINEEYKDLYLYYDSYGISRKYIKSKYNIDAIDIYKMDMLCKNKEAIQYCQTLESEEYNYNFNASRNVFEFYYKKDSKASGIMKVLEYLNVPIESSCAFGDDKNDIEMLETVGTGIAMGNASDKIKSHAKLVTSSVQNDGVAEGIEKFILA